MKVSSAEFVVIGQAWQLSAFAGKDAARPRAEVLAGGVLATIRFLARPGRHFLVIGAQVRPLGCKFDKMRILPGPLWHAPPPPCDPVPRRDALADESDLDDAIAVGLRGQPNVTLMRPVDVYCDEDCPVVENGLWLFQDAGHFTVAGAKRMGERAKAIIDRFLSDTAQAAR